MNEALMDGVALFMLAVGAALLASALAHFAIQFARRRSSRAKWIAALWTSLRWPAQIAIWTTGLRWVAEEALASVLKQSAADSLYRVGIVIALMVFLLSLLKQSEQLFIALVEHRRWGLSGASVRTAARLVKIAVIGSLALIIINEFGYDITSLLAIGGFGGLLAGLAAKDTLSNFFGAVTIHLDRPFEEGDFIEFPDQNLKGKVERIGLRATCVRNYQRQLIYVPNSAFSKLAIINRTRMTHRRISEVLGVRYEDLGKVKKITAALRAMLEEHPDIDSDESRVAYVESFGPSSVDIRIYVFTATTEWDEFNALRQDILLKAAEVIEANGAEIAFPTRTLHVSAPPGASASQIAAGPAIAQAGVGALPESSRESSREFSRRERRQGGGQGVD